MTERKYERIVAADPIGATWLRLKRLTSKRLCQQAIVSRNGAHLDPSILGQKANGMAWAIRSGLGYWETKSAGLNANVLSRYYALLQLSIAEQVGSANPEDLLPAIQRHTAFGHGLFTLTDPAPTFPDSLLIGCNTTGHFSAYARYTGADLRSYVFERKPRKYCDVDQAARARLVSLMDLLRRVPELQGVTEDFFGKPPLSFHVGYNTPKNMQMNPPFVPAATPNTRTPSNAVEVPGEKTTWINIYPARQGEALPDIAGHGFPFTDITEEADNIGGGRHLSAAFKHPSEGHWFNYLKTYKSAYSGTSVIVPFWGLDDPFILHFVILYAFSIVVRYLPDLWHEIEDGELDHIRALLEQYLVIVDHVLPQLVIERITGTRLLVVQPGSLSAPT